MLSGKGGKEVERMSLLDTLPEMSGKDKRARAVDDSDTSSEDRESLGDDERVQKMAKAFRTIIEVYKLGLSIKLSTYYLLAIL